MIAAVVLAAGLSTRMGGRSKALLSFDPRDTFVSRIVRTLADAHVAEVVVVTGHQRDQVEAAVRASGLPARLIPNEHYERGQFTSVIAGLDAIDRPDVDAVLLALVDAPLFSAATVRAVVERFEKTRAPVVRPVRGDEHGHPVLIARELFDELRHADPEQGAKPIVRGHVSLSGDVAVNDPGAFIDIDTPDDYARLPLLVESIRQAEAGG